MKNIWKKCLGEYKAWFKIEWKNYWKPLKSALIYFLSAFFVWAFSVIQAIFVGFWKLVVKPIGQWLRDKVIAFVNKL